MSLRKFWSGPVTQDEWSTFSEVAPLLQERVKLMPEVGEMSTFLFVDEVEYDERSWSKVMKGDTPAPALEGAIRRLSELETWTAESIEAALRSALEDTELNPRKGWQPLRVAVTGSQVSPPLFESMAAIGLESTIARLNRAVRVLETA